MRTLFAAWYPPDEGERRAFIEGGMIVPDTNILLNLYRMKVEARDDLISLLASMGDRLWIPYQVGLEFHRNRLTVIHDQEQVDQRLRDAIKDSQAKLLEAIRGIRDHPAIDRSTLEEIAKASFSRLVEYLNEASVIPFLQMKESIQGDVVLSAVTQLFENRVGQPYTTEQLAKARAEAKRRIDNKVPPGYMDAKKDELRAAGDYLAWRQTLDEAIKRKISVLFITNDQKEDWYHKVHGLTVGPRVELVEEMASEAGVKFHAQTLARFVDTAQSSEGKTVKDVTLSEVKRLDEIDLRLQGGDEEDAISAIQQHISDPNAAAFELLRRRPPLGNVTRDETIAATLRIQQRADRIRAEQSMIEAHLLDHRNEPDEEIDPRSHRRALESRYYANREQLQELETQLVDLERHRLPPT